MWRNLPVVCAAMAAMAAMLAAAPLPAQPATAAAGPADTEPLLLAGIMPKNTDEQYELSFWESIKNSNYAGDYEPT